MKFSIRLFFSVLILLVATSSNNVYAGVISKEQEISMGKSTARQLEAKYGLSQDYVLQERVQQIGNKLVAVCKRKDIEYSFKVLNSDEINALACPGGFIYVYKGLLDYMPSDTELAGVLSHEITHVTDKHTVHALEKQLLGGILMIGAAVATGGNGLPLMQTAEAAIFSGFSRTDERGADKGGLSLCLDAGYNPYSVLITMLKLDDYSKARELKNPYGVFSSHPEPEERAKRIKEQLAKLNIKPQVQIENDDKAAVTEGNWIFPVNHSIGATKAKYRAYILAGSLWTIRQKGPVDLNHFVVYDYGSTADIYYEDTQLYTIYAQETPNGSATGSYAAQCVESLKTWAKIANATPIKRKT